MHFHCYILVNVLQIVAIHAAVAIILLSSRILRMCEMNCQHTINNLEGDEVKQHQLLLTILLSSVELMDLGYHHSRLFLEPLRNSYHKYI